MRENEYVWDEKELCHITFNSVEYGSEQTWNTLNSLIKVPVLWEKTYQNLLRYSLFLAVLLERIHDFYMRYFYFSGTIEKILEDLNWKSIEMSTICFGNGI